MNTAVAVFVKTPSLSPVKTRLSATIGKPKAEAFYLLSLKAVAKTLRNVAVKPIWAVGEKEALNDPLWEEFEVLHTGEGDLGNRQHHIYQSLLKRYDKVLLMGSDSPQLCPIIFQDAITALDQHDFVIGPARDGGYYLFGGRLGLMEQNWTAVPWSVNCTREKLEAELPSKAFHLKMLTDVDHQEDLEQILQEMPEQMSDEQKQLVEWINL